MFSTDRLVDRIRAEYQALPGLKLTSEQACRLWAVDDAHCESAFEALLAEGFLHRTGTGKFVALPRPGGVSASAGIQSADGGRFEPSRLPIRCPHCRKLNTIQQEQGAHGHAAATFRCVACHRISVISEISA
jgi:hypothetical protein